MKSYRNEVNPRSEVECNQAYIWLAYIWFWPTHTLAYSYIGILIHMVLANLRNEVACNQEEALRNELVE